MTADRLSIKPVGVKENFQEGDQDGLQQNLRTVCGGGASVCDASCVDGEHLLPGRSERRLSRRSESAVRAGAFVLDVGRTDMPSGLPRLAVYPHRLHAA